MSFTTIPQRRQRLNRSTLAVPGSKPRFIEKAVTSSADVIFFDLEDSVPPDNKEQARKDVIAAINDLDFGGKSLSVRINGLDTHYMYRDVVDLVEQAGHKLDLILVPKVGCAADIYAVDMLLTQIERAKGIKKKIGIEMLIETPLGMQNIDAIAAASPRNESILFGSADYAAATGMQITMIGGPNPDYHVLGDADAQGVRHRYWLDMWHYPHARIVAAARANGLRPVDGPFADIKDPDGWMASAKRAKTLGFEGKMVIHPSQVDMANELFKPSAKEVEQARRILEAMVNAEKQGAGAVSLDGKMIDIASIRQAEAVVQKAELAAKKNS
ncbi:MAG: CoA ester lyase [Magnetococcales bacterium]|nr:CoA ester lyase [Magnetococcales bacterium]MBF0149555.1 CoA ester lyase [Magnetococcales bacterium]MBF0173481.1 CoA ester lyase [Magnetococcales bacterium]MBF0632068.1 CoA ester lyase [Magnetococcales bacterium]